MNSCLLHRLLPCLVLLFAVGCEDSSQLAASAAALDGPLTLADGVTSDRDTDGVRTAGGAIATPAPSSDAATVDCALRLPCPWIDPSGAFRVDIVAVDATTDGIVAAFAVRTLHDADVTLHTLYDAIGSRSRRLAATDGGFGDAAVGETVALLAGDTHTGRVAFLPDAPDGRLDLLAIGFRDTGLDRHTSFTALPVERTPAGDHRTAPVATFRAADAP